MRILVLLLTLASFAVLVAPDATAAPGPVCVPTDGGGLDYHSEACVDADGSGCRVWHDRATDRGVERTCYVPV